jgi:hypothetical protein
MVARKTLFFWPGFVLATVVIATPASANRGIWISDAELAKLPTTGPAWTAMKAEADEATGTPDVSDQEDPVNVRVMAKALVYGKTREERYRADVVNACMAAIDTERGGRTLALGRELVAYVIAADIVGMPADKDVTFKAWLRRTLTETLEDKTLVSTHEVRPNNWGTVAGASRIAVARYLGDTAELERAALVFRGWLGDRAAYSGFKYGELDWQADPSRPVAINPKGATKDGRNIDGVLPDDQRRAGGFTWPPQKENYVYSALQGALPQAIMLHRAGYDVWNWSDKALLRSFQWLHQQASFPAEGDDEWQPHVINRFYATSFPAPVPAEPGKNVGWTDWTLSVASAPPPTGGCSDGIKGQTETDVDCGGTCAACGKGKQCLIHTDCASKICERFQCVALPAPELLDVKPLPDATPN